MSLALNCVRTGTQSTEGVIHSLINSLLFTIARNVDQFVWNEFHFASENQMKHLHT